MKYVIIDTETTGLNPEDGHEIIEFGAIVLINKMITEKLEIKIKPESLDRASKEAMRINGYSDYKWRYALPQNQAAKMIWAFIESHRDGIMVGHNLNFDKKFVEALGKKNDMPIKISMPYMDTRDLCRANLAPYGLESMKLDNICYFLGWRRRNAHTALSDCEDCARLIQNLCPPKIEFVLKLKFKKLINLIGEWL
jgi:DNA polymerase-3 subunit epsilon